MLLTGAVLSLVGVVVLAWAWSSTELPEQALSPANIASARVTDRAGILLREVLTREDGRATWTPLAEISPHLIQATLAGEDQRFFKHGGVDYLAMGRAAWQGISQQELVSGASTLSMQLGRLVAPLPRSVVGKLKQIVLAYKLEARLTKDEILWHYLNRAPYGNGTFGVGAAARRYFDRPPARLSLAQAALLAALPRAPSAYNPFRHISRLKKRQHYLLSLMESQGRITSAQGRLARQEQVDWEAAVRPFAAPHAVRHALALASKLGGGAAPASITTTLDGKLQREVAAAVTSTVDRLRAQGVSNAAALVVDNATGTVLAHVGSAGFFDQGHSGQVDDALALRQPGSTLKPFTYALAMEMGKTPASLLRDLPARFTTDEGDYHPRNYDNTFHGPVLMRVALASSYNVPAVRLARFVGVQRLLDRLRAAGMASLTRTARHYGLGLTLGNGEVTLYELVGAYTALARGGAYRPPRLLKEVRAAGGKLLPLPPAPADKRIFSEGISYLISHILSDPMARLPAFGRRGPLELPFPAAAKTGTSKDFRDNWTVGYTPRHTVGVWVGNFDGASMHNVSGVSGAGPLWAEVMTLASRRFETDTFARPQGLREYRICTLSGELAGPHCPGSRDELFLAEAAAPGICAFHRELRVDNQTGLLAGPGCAEEQVTRQLFTLYPPAYGAWAAARDVPAAPTAYAPRCPAAGATATAMPARIRVRAPSPGDRYYVDPDLARGFQAIPLEAEVTGSAREVRWLVDGHEVARAPAPYSASWKIRRGRHTVQAVLPGGERSDPIKIAVD